MQVYKFSHYVNIFHILFCFSKMITEIGNMVWNGQGFVRVCCQRWLPSSVDHSPLGFTFQSCETSFICPEKCEWSICMIKSKKMHKHFHSDSSISALIYVEPYKRESKVSIFLEGPAICLFLYAIELNFWKELREKDNFRFMFFSKF